MKGISLALPILLLASSAFASPLVEVEPVEDTVVHPDGEELLGCSFVYGPSSVKNVKTINSKTAITSHVTITQDVTKTVTVPKTVTTHITDRKTKTTTMLMDGTVSKTKTIDVTTYEVSNSIVQPRPVHAHLCRMVPSL